MFDSCFLQGDLDDDTADMPQRTLSESMDRRLRLSHSSGDRQAIQPGAVPSPQRTVLPNHSNVHRGSSSVPTATSAATATSTTTTTPTYDGTQTDELKKKKSATTREDDDEEQEDQNDSDFDYEFDDDDQALEAFRQRRLAELKQAHAAATEHAAKGHGEVRTISQDEFLPECGGESSSKYVVVHFFHNDFERCKIMDHHLKIIAPLHMSCKFVRINAEKAPFFVAKLAIQTLPTLLVFKDGKTIDRLVGFEGFSDPKTPDEFPTSRLGRWLERTGAIEYEGPDSDDEEDDGRQQEGTGGLLSCRHRVFDEDM